MSFNITVVAFDREPNLDDVLLMEYRGFDGDLVGKETLCTLHFYEVKTDVAGARVIHVQFRDQLVSSDNMVLVFEDIIPEGTTTAADIPVETTERVQGVLAETVQRLECFDLSRVQHGYSYGRSMVFCFLGVKKVIDEDIAMGNRKTFKVIKDEG
jgi:hypothetical protein